MSKKTNPDLQAAIDARLSDALASANYRITLTNQKQNAKLKLQKDLTYSINGGTFSITPELISFVTALLTHNKTHAILLDVNMNPVEIGDLKAFNKTIIGTYYECTNDYLAEFASLQKSRSTKALVGES